MLQASNDVRWNKQILTMLGAFNNITCCKHKSLLVLHCGILHCGTCSLPQSRILRCSTKGVKHQSSEVYLSNKD